MLLELTMTLEDDKRVYRESFRIDEALLEVWAGNRNQLLRHVAAEITEHVLKAFDGHTKTTTS